ncbi:MAG: LysM peptidoglycan-binding domain-containing protein [Anaerolineaceae bacterium]|nr:LysM peptidoglycan-binding domain-containing protein [Anaerolineaceae bacterium]
MNAVTDFIENLRNNLVTAVAVFLIVVILLGYLAFSITSILPQWRLRSELIPQVASAELQVTQAAQSSNTSISTLRAQIESAPTRLVQTASSIMVSDTREAQILDNLYQYADANGVAVAGLQVQSAPSTTENELYSIRQFRVEVSGPLPQLLAFLANVRETQLPGFVLTNVSINQQTLTDVLVMDVYLYTSSHVDVALAPTLAAPSESEVVAPAATPTSESTAAAAGNGRYEVRRGDTLLSVSLQHNVSLSALKSANGLSDNTIFPGQELLIP